MVQQYDSRDKLVIMTLSETMTELISIRKEEEGDSKSVYDLVRKAFDSPVQADLVTRLREESNPKLSLVALKGQALVGHIFYSPVEVENNLTGLAAAQLSPVSVLPEHQGKGIGSLLIESSFNQCLEIGWSALFLVGNPRYYYRFGFEMANTRNFNHEGPHGEYLQCKELIPDVFESLSGGIKFHSVFEEIAGE